VDSLKAEIKTHTDINEGRLKEESVASVHNDIERMEREITNLERKLLPKRQNRDEIATKNAPEILLQRLNVAINEAEERSVDVMDRFTRGEFQLPDFVKNYYNARVVYHARMAKADRLQEILEQQPR